MALAAGLLLSMVVYYRFYVTRVRDTVTYGLMASSNFVLIVGTRLLPTGVPGPIVGLLWLGFLFSLAMAIFWQEMAIEW